MIEHPAYDAFWQGQALDKLLAAQPLDRADDVVQGLWDQEDMYGAIHGYDAVEPKDTAQRSQLSGDGPVAPQPGELRRHRRSGRCKLDGDTALQFRRDVHASRSSTST